MRLINESKDKDSLEFYFQYLDLTFDDVASLDIFCDKKIIFYLWL